MTGLPGLPALDRALLPKPYRDLWPDSALEMGGGKELFMGQGPWADIWGKDILDCWGRSQHHFEYYGWGRGGNLVSLFGSGTIKSHLGLDGYVGN